MQIFIRNSSIGFTTALDVECSDTVVNIKSQIPTSWSTDLTTIIFNGKYLNDNKKLEDYNIRHGSTLHYSLALSPVSPLIDLTVRVLNKEISYSIKANKSDSVNDIKVKLCKSQNVTLDTDQILTLKLTYRDYVDLEPLDDHDLLVNRLSGPTRHYTLYLARRRDLSNEGVFVHDMSECLYSYPLSLSDTLGDLKFAIHLRQGIPPQQQVLIHGVKQLADETKTLSYYGILPGQQVDMYIAPTQCDRDQALKNIFVETLVGHCITQPIKPSDTIKQVKMLIYNHIGVPPDDQSLIYAGKQLLKDDKTLHEYDVRNETSLHLVVRLRHVAPAININIFVKTLTGERITLAVKPSDTIKDVKVLYQNQMGIHPEGQRLSYKGKLLEDDKSWHESNALNQLRLVYRGVVLRENIDSDVAGNNIENEFHYSYHRTPSKRQYAHIHCRDRYMGDLYVKR